MGFLEDYGNENVGELLIGEQVHTGLDQRLRVRQDLHFLHLEHKGSHQLIVTWEILPFDELDLLTQLR